MATVKRTSWYVAALALIWLPYRAAAQDHKAVDLVILAGQSNAVGFDADPADLPADPIDHQVLLWWRSGDPLPDKHDSLGQSWQSLRPQPLGDPITPKRARQYGNFAQPAGGFGPEMTFARSYVKRTKRPLAILKVAFSGTEIHRDWSPDPQQPGPCFQALCDEFAAADKAADAKGIRLRPTAFLWVQGESDASEQHALKYQQRLTHLIAAVRKQVNVADLPALVAVNTRFGLGKKPFMPQIVQAQKDCAMSDANTTYVDTSAAPVINSAHYSTAGTLMVGKLFDDALVKPSTDSAAPSRASR